MPGTDSNIKNAENVTIKHIRVKTSWLQQQAILTFMDPQELKTEDYNRVYGHDPHYQKVDPEPQLLPLSYGRQAQGGLQIMLTHPYSVYANPSNQLFSCEEIKKAEVTFVANSSTEPHKIHGLKNETYPEPSTLVFFLPQDSTNSQGLLFDNLEKIEAFLQQYGQDGQYASISNFFKSQVYAEIMAIYLDKIHTEVEYEFFRVKTSWLQQQAVLTFADNPRELKNKDYNRVYGRDRPINEPKDLEILPLSYGKKTADGLQIMLTHPYSVYANPSKQLFLRNEIKEAEPIELLSFDQFCTLQDKKCTEPSSLVFFLPSAQDPSKGLLFDNKEIISSFLRHHTSIDSFLNSKAYLHSKVYLLISFDKYGIFDGEKDRYHAANHSWMQGGLPTSTYSLYTEKFDSPQSMFPNIDGYDKLIRDNQLVEGCLMLNDKEEWLAINFPWKLTLSDIKKHFPKTFKAHNKHAAYFLNPIKKVEEMIEEPSEAEIIGRQQSSLSQLASLFKTGEKDTNAHQYPYEPLTSLWKNNIPEFLTIIPKLIICNKDTVFCEHHYDGLSPLGKKSIPQQGRVEPKPLDNNEKTPLIKKESIPQQSQSIFSLFNSWKKNTTAHQPSQEEKGNMPQQQSQSLLSLFNPWKKNIDTLQAPQEENDAPIRYKEGIDPQPLYVDEKAALIKYPFA